MSENKTESKVRKNLRLPQKAIDIIKTRKESGEFVSENVFVEKAILFYDEVLKAEDGRAFLGDEIIKAMKAISQNSDGRLFSHMRSMDISLTMLTLLFAYNLADMSEAEVSELRREAVEYVNNNRRAVPFITALRAEKEEIE